MSTDRQTDRQTNMSPYRAACEQLIMYTMSYSFRFNNVLQCTNIGGISFGGPYSMMGTSYSGLGCHPPPQTWLRMCLPGTPFILLGAWREVMILMKTKCLAQEQTGWPLVMDNTSCSLYYCYKVLNYINFCILFISLFLPIWYASWLLLVFFCGYYELISG